MPRHVVVANGHTIEVVTTGWGPEYVLYDGEEVSRKTTIMGAVHIFNKVEDGSNVQYEVDIRAGLLSAFVAVRREGRVIFTNR